MQLTRFTDFGLRVLMYLTQCRDRPAAVTIPEIAARFDLSRNHLVKVVHFMSQRGWVSTARGKGGGLALARPAADYRLGDLVRELEQQGLYEALNGYSLADLVRDPTAAAIIKLHRAA